MPTITPLPAFDDNYIWLLQSGAETVCVDPGDAAPVLAHLQQQGVPLTQIWITHHHHDHTGGVAALLAAYPDCAVYGYHDIAAATHTVGEGSCLHIDTAEAEVWHTPGHTDGHVSYLLHTSDGLHVFCGDTLFSAGCGRVFTGTIGQLADSFGRYRSLPPDTRFYPAHEYTAANLRFAAHIEPDNADVQTALQQARHTPTLPVTLAHECTVNPFLRVTQSAVQARVQALTGVAPTDDTAVFAALRTLKNTF